MKTINCYADIEKLKVVRGDNVEVPQKRYNPQTGRHDLSIMLKGIFWTGENPRTQGFTMVYEKEGLVYIDDIYADNKGKYPARGLQGWITIRGMDDQEQYLEAIKNAGATQ